MNTTVHSIYSTYAKKSFTQIYKSNQRFCYFLDLFDLQFRHDVMYEDDIWIVVENLEFCRRRACSLDVFRSYQCEKPRSGCAIDVLQSSEGIRFDRVLRKEPVSYSFLDLTTWEKSV